MAHGAPPFAILWSPIPLITWIVPFIGHMGLSSSSGGAVDFAGPYSVHEDEDGIMIFGPPTRYLVLDPLRALALAQTSEPLPPVSSGSDSSVGTLAEGGQRLQADMDAAALARWWDAQLAITATSFRGQFYNIFGNNCHALVSSFLNQIGYNRSSKWNMIKAAAAVFLCGRYTSILGLLYTWTPFVVIAGIGGYFGRLYFLYAWLAITVPLVLWFVVYVLALEKRMTRTTCKP